MKTILFKELHGDIQERKSKIESFQTQQNSLLEIDEKNKIVISPEKKDRAKQIAAAISELRRKNELDSALLARVTDIARRFNVDLSEMHQLTMLIPMYERQISDVEEIIKEYDRMGLDKQKESKNSPYFLKEELLKRAQVSLSNCEAAKKELSEVMTELKL